MKKLCVAAAVMVASLIPVGASASEPETIVTWQQFKNSAGVDAMVNGDPVSIVFKYRREWKCNQLSGEFVNKRATYQTAVGERRGFLCIDPLYDNRR